MEIFLLLLDDLDDLAHALRIMLPKFIGFCLALGIFALTAISAMRWPVALAGVALAVLMIVILRNGVSVGLPTRFKTDP